MPARNSVSRGGGISAKAMTSFQSFSGGALTSTTDLTTKVEGWGLTKCSTLKNEGVRETQPTTWRRFVCVPNALPERHSRGRHPERQGREQAAQPSEYRSGLRARQPAEQHPESQWEARQPSCKSRSCAAPCSCA